MAFLIHYSSRSHKDKIVHSRIQAKVSLEVVNVISHYQSSHQSMIFIQLGTTMEERAREPGGISSRMQRVLKSIGQLELFAETVRETYARIRTNRQEHRENVIKAEARRGESQGFER